MRTSNANFLLSIRESGYKDLSAALCELVDNALDASARSVSISIRCEIENGVHVIIADDGTGMDSLELGESIRFGGAAHYGSRSRIGRFGMGLPASSLSQSRRFEVYSRKNGSQINAVGFDIDDAVLGRHTVPRLREDANAFLHSHRSGTVVIWNRCDKIESKNLSQLLSNAAQTLGRVFRRFILKGIRIYLNEIELLPIDPLMLQTDGLNGGASIFGEPLKYAFKSLTGDSGDVFVRFSILPIPRWAGLSSELKKQSGITRGAGVSILRAGREISFGWHFLRNKRKENYDDWWRCEVDFSPTLDEYFGVNFLKQGISPTEELRDILEPDFEEIAKALSNRVRCSFASLKSSTTGRAVAGREKNLPAFKFGTSQVSHSSNTPAVTYHIEAKPIETMEVFTVKAKHRAIRVTVNSLHPFSDQLLREKKKARQISLVECILYAMARTELSMGKSSRETMRKFNLEWGRALAAFLGN